MESATSITPSPYTAELGRRFDEILRTINPQEDAHKTLIDILRARGMCEEDIAAIKEHFIGADVKLSAYDMKLLREYGSAGIFGEHVGRVAEAAQGGLTPQEHAQLAGGLMEAKGNALRELGNWGLSQARRIFGMLKTEAPRAAARGVARAATQK